MSSVGENKDKKKVFHFGNSTRIYLQEKNTKWTVLTTTFDEFCKYHESLLSTGPEQKLKKYFGDLVSKIHEERLEKERIEALRLEKLRRKEQKRLEYELLLAMPRRSGRERKNYTNFFEKMESSSSNEDDYIYRDEQDDDQEEKADVEMNSEKEDDSAKENSKKDDSVGEKDAEKDDSAKVNSEKEEGSAEMNSEKDNSVEMNSEKDAESAILDEAQEKSTLSTTSSVGKENPVFDHENENPSKIVKLDSVTRDFGHTEPLASN